jgi:cellulose synthase operon protein C
MTEVAAGAEEQGPVDKLVEAIKQVDRLLDEEVLEPRLERDDWARMKARVRMLEEAIAAAIDAVPAALAAVEGTDVGAKIQRRVAGLAAASAAVVCAGGDRFAAAKLITAARKIARDPAQLDELAAAGAEPEIHCRLQHGLWLLGHGRRAEADKVWKTVLRTTKQPVHKALAKKGYDAPRPITSAPALFRLNGCGAGIYGSRDRDEDGFHVATYCVCILWVPVFPLTAYRVRNAGGSTYQFRARERLGPVARAYQMRVLAAVVGLVGFAGIQSYLNSPGRRARIAFEQAKAAAAAGDREGAIERYRDALSLYDGMRELEDSAERVVRLTLATFPDPCTAASVDAAGRFVNAFGDLPSACRSGAPAVLMAKRLGQCVDQIGDATVAQASAGLAVLDMEAKIADGTVEQGSVETRRAALRRRLADQIVGERPLQALVLYTLAAPDPAALAAARTIIEGLGPAPSLWIEAAHEIDVWLAAVARDASQNAAASAIRTRLEDARTAHTADLALVEVGDEKLIAKALARMPGDQELAVALADLKRRRGDTTGALATLTAIGPPGRMTAAAQQLLGATYAGAGDLAKADAVLTALLADRLPPFQEAQRAYLGEAQRLRHNLVESAKLGNLPPELDRKMEGASDDEKMEIFGQWLSARVDGDERLAGLRAEYLRHAAVVPASLSLGTVKLRRAHDATGDERKALLTDAERVMLSIRQEAEGDPSFQLGLGQVYHQLGRPKDGDAELQQALDRKDPDLTLQVVLIYRELGLMLRAKQIAEELYASSSAEDVKETTALLLANIVPNLGFNEDEEETWLGRAHKGAPDVKARLLEVEGRKLQRQGKLGDADRAYAEAADIYRRNATHSAGAANNAALEEMARYGVTGDPAHLRVAVRDLETAVRLDPRSALAAGNLGDALAYLGSVTVLDRWVRTRVLLLGERDAGGVVATLADGPLHDDVIAALRADPSFRRSLDLSQSQQALAPQSADAYQRPLKWLSWSRDDKGLADLAKRIDALPALDGGDEAARRASWESRAKDEQLKPLQERAVANAKEVLARAKQSGHGPTLAIAWMELSEALAGLDAVAPSADRQDEMLDASRKAAAAWPEGGMDDAPSGLLLYIGVLRAAAECPPLAKAHDAEGRIYDLGMVVHRALGGPDGEAILAALHKRPELGEAARLRRSRALARPSLFDVILAEAAGDADLARAADGAFARADLGAFYAVELKLAPGQAKEKAYVDLWQRGPRKP